MRIACPFADEFFMTIDCVYMKTQECGEIDINPGNSDAWCNRMIWKGIGAEEKKDEQRQP